MATTAHDLPAERTRTKVAHHLAVALKPRWGWLGVALMLFGLALIYLLIAAWPAATAAVPAGKPRTAIHWFGWSYTPPDDDTALLILVVIVSALGSYVHAATSFADYAGNRKLTPSWLWWYMLRIFIGCSLAVLFYLALRGGFFPSTDDSGKINPYGIAALAGLVGLFSKQATDKLREIFDTAFQTRKGYGDDARANGIVNRVPVLAAAEPPTLVAGQTLMLTLRGSGFTRDSIVRVVQPSGEAVARTTSVVDDASLQVQLDAADIGAAGTLRFNVYTPPPGGGTSEQLELEIVEA